MCDLQDGDKWRRLWCEELGKAGGEIGRAGCGLGVGRKQDRWRLPSMKSCHHAFWFGPCWFYTWLAVSAPLRCSNMPRTHWDVACAVIGRPWWTCSPSHWCNSWINHQVCCTVRGSGEKGKAEGKQEKIHQCPFINLLCLSLKAKT